jgi:hypothetical protein
MKRLLIAACLMACAFTVGCTTTGGGYSGSGNRDYARNCGYAMDELLLCNGSYVGPHEF